MYFQTFVRRLCFLIFLSNASSPIVLGNFNVVAYFHGYTSQWDQYPVSLFRRQMQHIIFSKTSNETIITKSFKYCDCLNLIFISIHTSRQTKLAIKVTVRIFKNLLMDSHTVVVFFGADNLLLSSSYFFKICSKWSTCEAFKDLFSTPSLKLQLTLHTNNHITTASVISNKYCTGNSIAQETNFDDLLVSGRNYVIVLHRSQFWASNNEPEFAYIAYTHDGFYKETLSKQFLCTQIYKRLRYKRLPDALHCWAKQMLAIELSKVHNISFKFANKPEIYKTFISQDIRSNYEKHFYSGIYLQYYSGWNYFYCLDDSLQISPFKLGYNVWIKPMSPLIWILLFVTWISSTIFYPFRQDQKYPSLKFEDLIVSFRILIKSPAHNLPSGKWIVIVAIAGMFICARYENEITSRMTVDKGHQAFEYMHDFIANGFRMVEGEKYPPGCPHKLDSNYFCAKYKSLSNYDYILQKLSWRRPSWWKHWYLYKNKGEYKRQYGSSLDCYYVHEEVDTEPWFLVINTQNRHWLLKTVENIHAGGFMRMWNDLAQFSTDNFDRETYLLEDDGKGLVVIVQMKIWPVVYFCGLIQSFSCIVFFGEILTKHKLFKGRLYTYIFEICVRSLHNLRIIINVMKTDTMR